MIKFLPPPRCLYNTRCVAQISRLDRRRFETVPFVKRVCLPSEIQNGTRKWYVYVSRSRNQYSFNFEAQILGTLKPQYPELWRFVFKHDKSRNDFFVCNISFVSVIEFFAARRYLHRRRIRFSTKRHPTLVESRFRTAENAYVNILRKVRVFPKIVKLNSHVMRLAARRCCTQLVVHTRRYI